MSSKISSAILDILQTVALALGIFLIVYFFLVRPHEVRGESMYPTLHNMEFLLTDKISYRTGSPKRGDIIVFRAPVEPVEDFIKRIIGLPGEKIMIKDGKVFINANMLDESYIPTDVKTFGGFSLPEGKEVEIPADKYIVMGDNRENSADSRRFGPIDKKRIVGRAWVRYWPPSTAGIIHH